MAQHQRRENKTDERQIHVEKDKVPKMASHFESLTVKDSGDQPVVHHVTGTMHGIAGGIHDQNQANDQYKGPSLEEISKYRGVAQQNSMDAIRAAEEQYRKAKETGGETGRVTAGQVTKNNVSGGAQSAMDKGGQIGQQAKDRFSGATQTAAEGVARASDYTVLKGQQAKETLSSAAQTAAEKAARAKDYTLEKSQQTGQQAKESLSSAAQTAMEKAAMAKDYTFEKSGQAKDVVAEKTTGMAGTAVDVTKKGASYVGEKAVAAKDVALESGTATAGYVGKVAGVVKDKAVVAGWSAAEFASDKAVGATETMANVASGVAGYAGNTAVATKDVLVDVAKKTKDVVVSTEESAKEYAARKKAEKQRELEAKNSKDEGEWAGEGQDVCLEHPGGSSYLKEGVFGRQGGGSSGVGNEEAGGFVGKDGFGQQGVAGAGGVMRVIGETLMEIGQNTKDMFVGHGGYEGEGERKDEFRG